MRGPLQTGLVIFDCDGVLVDSEPIVIRVLVDRLRHLGIDISEEEASQEFIGLAQDAATDQIARRLGAAVPARWLAQLTAEVDAALQAQVQPVPGVAAVLDRLDIPFCAASNGRPEKLAITLRATGLAKYFEDRVFTAAQVARGKPAPDLFLLAATRMGVLPDRCVVIEDSASGVIAARAAGMRVLTYAANGSQPSADSDHVFSSMVELPALLGLPAR